MGSTLPNVRLVESPRLKPRWARKQGLDYYLTGENEEYFSDEILLLDKREADELVRAGDTAFQLLRATAKRSLNFAARRAELGIPDHALKLIEWSVENEWDHYLLGRWDFAGGIDGRSLKLIEFNADTASLLPETLVFQPEIVRKAGLSPLAGDVRADLLRRFQTLGGGRTDTARVVAHLGHPDDEANSEQLRALAEEAGWGRTDVIHLADLALNPDEGLFREVEIDRWIQYGTLVKFFPWDYALFEEPDLFDYLAELVMDRGLRVLNPAWTLLLQSKALLAHAWKDNPGHPLLLPTAMVPEDLPAPLAGYVRKPRFGRTGDNVAVILNGRDLVAEKGGHYGDQTMVYQQLATYNTDDEDYRYQLSTYQTDRATGVCCRRLNEWIMDDEAEFVPVAVR